MMTGLDRVRQWVLARWILGVYALLQWLLAILVPVLMVLGRVNTSPLMYGALVLAPALVLGPVLVVMSRQPDNRWLRLGLELAAWLRWPASIAALVGLFAVLRSFGSLSTVLNLTDYTVLATQILAAAQIVAVGTWPLITDAPPGDTGARWIRRAQTIIGGLRQPVLRLAGLLDRIPKWVLVGLVGAIPAILTHTLVLTLFRTPLTSFVPNEWNDQVQDWSEIQTFIRVGFHGGYYGWNEQSAPIRALHFSQHGPIPPIIYGTIGRVVGWDYYTPILINMAFVAIGLWSFAALIRPNLAQIALMGAVVGTFWPLLLAIPTASPESLHQGTAIVLAGIFAAMLKDRDSTPTGAKVAGLFLLLIVSVMRYSWSYLLIPYLSLWFGARSWRSRALTMTLGFLLIPLILLVVYLTTSPHGIGLLSSSYLEGTSASERALSLRGRIGFNLLGMFRYPVSLLELLQIGIIGASSLGGLLLSRSNEVERPALMSTQEALFSLYNLAPVATVAFGVYVISQYWRLLAPPLLVALFLLIACKRYRIVAVAVVLSVLAYRGFLDQYTTHGFNFNLDREALAAYREMVAEEITYDATTDNPWCNTVLMPYVMYDYRGILMPPGVGVSLLVGPYPATIPPLKSRYLLVNATGDDYAIFIRPLEPGLHLVRVASWPIGDLYYNQDSGCGP